MRFRLEIECDGAAFDGDACGDEISRILQQTAHYVTGGSVDSLDGSAFSIRDVYGNRVGRWVCD